MTHNDDCIPEIFKRTINNRVFFSTYLGRPSFSILKNKFYKNALNLFKNQFPRSDWVTQNWKAILVLCKHWVTTKPISNNYCWVTAGLARFLHVSAFSSSYRTMLIMLSALSINCRLHNSECVNPLKLYVLWLSGSTIGKKIISALKMQNILLFPIKMLQFSNIAITIMDISLLLPIKLLLSNFPIAVFLYCYTYSYRTFAILQARNSDKKRN